MADNRLVAQIQHTIQYPSGHLDRWASFGPAFEMDGPGGRPEVTAAPAAPIDRPADQPEDQPISSQFDAKRFILAGNATLTLQGIQTRYTFNAKRSDPDQQGNSVVFLSLLTGPDNGSDYTYVGLIDQATGQIRLTRKSRYTTEAGPVRAWNWAMRRIWAGRSIEPARLFHEGRCGRCNRRLTVPESIVTGFGPECAGRMG